MFDSYRDEHGDQRDTLDKVVFHWKSGNIARRIGIANTPRENRGQTTIQPKNVLCPLTGGILLGDRVTDGGLTGILLVVAKLYGITSVRRSGFYNHRII